jgi:predicted naringenin-chalcone synthase
MSLLAIGTATPPLELGQDESLAFILNNLPMKNATRVLYERVFRHESIRTRRFALPKIDAVLETDPDTVNERFEKAAVSLSAQSLAEALRRAGRMPTDVNFLAVTTCTGYVCPGLSSHVIEEAGLNKDIAHIDMVGMGCGAAIPALRQAIAHLAAHPNVLAAVISTEICSAAMFSGDAPDLVISNAIFADGSAAVLLGKQTTGQPSLVDFSSLVVPEWRDEIRFRTDGGRLRNVLSKEIPSRAAEAAEKILEPLFKRHGLTRKDISHWALHPGGEKVISALQKKLDLSSDALRPTRETLQRYGNLSSPAVLFVLEKILTEKKVNAGEWGVLLSFGAGFSATPRPSSPFKA